MTNAELIKALRYCISDNADDCDLCPYQIDCKSNGTGKDKMIRDASDALEAAEAKIVKLNTKCADLQSQIYEMENEIEELLPKEGEWIKDDTTYCGADRANYKCSLCGKIGGTWKRGLTQDELPNYCPNCGARMRGEHNDER